MLLSQVLNGILLPFVLIFILILINRQRLMGAYVNRPVYNGLAWLAVAFLIAVTLLLIGFSLQEVLQ